VERLKEVSEGCGGKKRVKGKVKESRGCSQASDVLRLTQSRAKNERPPITSPLFDTLRHEYKIRGFVRQIGDRLETDCYF